MSYYGTLYFNTDTKRLYLFDPTGRCPNGATLCYRKTWWEQNCFAEQQLGEDTIFAEAAITLNSFAWLNAEQNMVVRTHALNSCASARNMGSSRFPEISLDNLPDKFIKDTL